MASNNIRLVISTRSRSAKLRMVAYDILDHVFDRYPEKRGNAPRIVAAAIEKARKA